MPPPRLAELGGIDLRGMLVQDEVLNDARWWAGIPLAERHAAALSSTQTRGAKDLGASQIKRGSERVRRWHDGSTPECPPLSLAAWSARLGLQREALLRLLGEAPESLRHRLPRPPAWLRVLTEAQRQFPGEPFPAGRAGIGAHDLGYPAPAPSAEAGRALLNWTGPLVRWARERLRELVIATDPSAGEVPFSHALYAPDSARLLAMVKQALAMELGAARRAGQLHGSTPEGRFADFARWLADPGNALALLAKYPVLARDLVTHLQTWVEVRSEFVARLLSDFPALRERFAVAGSKLADLVAVDFGAGDSHYGGRSVAIVTFPQGRRLVYKPRDLGAEAGLAGLFRWINGCGLRFTLQPPEIIERSGYGWCAFVHEEPCRDEGELARFYWRQGAYLALFYALRCYDMHYQNLVAAGEHPVYFDLETTFHAEPSSATARPAAEAGEQVGQLLRDSVLAVGLLPQRIVEIGEGGARAMEISGLAGGGAPGELDVRETIGFTGEGTDQMRAVRVRLPLPATGNRPLLRGGHVDPRLWEDELLGGFQDCYRLLLRRRDGLLAADGPLAAFAGKRIRHVLRDTARYKAILEGSWDPGLLSDAANREYMQAACVADAGKAVDQAAVTESERRQLGNMDVPAFFTTPASTTLFDEQGPVAAAFLGQTGLHAVRRRLQKLSGEDLRRQMWFVRASLATRQTGAHHQSEDLPERPLSREEISEDLALAAASRVGDELASTVVRGDGGVIEWASLNLAGGQYWVIGPSGLGLYSGVGGIALFLAELGSATGSPRYQRLAEDVLAVLADPADLPEPEDLAGMPVGGYSDLGGTLYLLTRLGVAWSAPALLDVAHRLVPAMTQNLADDETGDIVSGAAGGTLALILLHHADPDQATIGAIRCFGEALLARALPLVAHRQAAAHTAATGEPPAGFAYGLAGQAYALAAIGDVTADDRFAAASVAILDREERRLRASARSAHATGAGRARNAWCCGAAGIALARAGVDGLTLPRRQGHQRGLPPEAGAARADLLRGVGNDSLCHGTLGLAETLLTHGEAVGDGELIAIARRGAAAVARRVLAGDVRTGVPSRVWSPGLLNGAAGVGYGLLRIAMPQRLPNVLMLHGS
jgi:class II lanthipeptide synthase